MENFNKLKHLERKVIRNALTEEDQDFLRSTLTEPTTDTITLKKYNKDDSEKLMSIIQKSNAVSIILQMTYKQKYKSFFTDDIFNALFELLFITSNFSSSDALIEFENVKKELNVKVMRIIKRVPNEAIKHKIVDFLHNKTDTDVYVINFALFVERITSIKNKEARKLNARKINKALLSVIEGNKNVLIEDNLLEIFGLCKNMLLNDSRKENDDEAGVLVALISEINPTIKEKDLDLIEYVPESINEAYVGFLYSLMVDSESTSKVFTVINEAGVINTIFDMLASAHGYTHPIDETEDPQISFLMFGLKLIRRLIVFMPDLTQFFISNCDVFINSLWTNLNDKIAGFLFEFVSNLLTDDDVRNKVYDYLVYMDIFKPKPSIHNHKNNHRCESVYNIFERESKHKDFYFTEGFVLFCSAFVSYKMLEPEIFAFFNVAIESSNTAIVIAILRKMGENELLLNNKILTSIKKGIESDDHICDTFVDFVINLKDDSQKRVLDHVTKDVSFLSLIFSISSKRFFSFMYLLDLTEVAMFLGDEFLDRINENTGEGLNFLIYACKKNNEICRFILRKVDYMNTLLDHDALKLKLYDIICDNYLNEFEAVVGKTNEKNVFVLPELHTSDFFSILAKLVLNEHENKGKATKFALNEYKYNEESIMSYCRYLKCLCVISKSIEKEMSYLTSLENGSEYISDVVCYSNIINNTNYHYQSESSALQTTLLYSMGTKNNDLFIAKYDNASKFDKYLLFFVLDTSNLTKDVYDIVVKQLHSVSNKLDNEENTLFFRHCLNVLMHYTKLDDVIKLFNSVEVPEKYINKIVMLNIVNLLNDNVEILSMNIITKASYDLQTKMCFIIWVKQLLKNEDVKNWALVLKKHVVDEELEFMLKEMDKIKA